MRNAFTMNIDSAFSSKSHSWHFDLRWLTLIHCENSFGFEGKTRRILCSFSNLHSLRFVARIIQIQILNARNFFSSTFCCSIWLLFLLSSLIQFEWIKELVANLHASDAIPDIRFTFFSSNPLMPVASTWVDNMQHISYKHLSFVSQSHFCLSSN